MAESSSVIELLAPVAGVYVGSIGFEGCLSAVSLAVQERVAVDVVATADAVVDAAAAALADAVGCVLVDDTAAAVADVAVVDAALAVVVFVDTAAGVDADDEPVLVGEFGLSYVPWSQTLEDEWALGVRHTGYLE